MAIPTHHQEVMTKSRCLANTFDGSYHFEVVGYSAIKGIGIGKSIRSATFKVGGYQWAILYYPDGSSPEAGKAEHISLFLELVSDVQDVRVMFGFSLLDRNGTPSPATKLSGSHTFQYRGDNSGWSKYIGMSVLHKSECLVDDCFTIYCTVCVVQPPRVEVASSICVPPSDLHGHLGQLLATGEGADVTFAVGGETFTAHRIVLAARSPVFKAQLYGPMKEEDACIKVRDIEAMAFKALLHFIYTDSLPETKELISDGTEVDLIVLAQHLLAAADRYGVERLRLLCEDRLARAISVSTVATTLSLAEQHQCHQLKAACLNFITSSGKMKDIVATEGFLHLTSCCPLVIREIFEKMPI